MLKVGQTFDVYETLTDGGYINKKGKWGIDLGNASSSNLVNLLLDGRYSSGLTFGVKNCYTGVEAKKVAVLKITKLKP